MKNPTVFEIIAKRIIEIDPDLEVYGLKRTRAGSNMRSSGAFSWMGSIKGSAFSIGSSTPASELAKAKDLKMTYCSWNGAYELEAVKNHTYKP